MTQIINQTERPIDTVALIKRMLIGAVIGFAVISIFVFGVDEPGPDWGTYWMIRPLIVTPLAGAAGGAFYYFMDYISYQGGWKRIVTDILSFIAFLIAIWFGTILGLVGTMWH